MDSNDGARAFSFKFSKTVKPYKVDKSKIQNEEDKYSKELEFVKSVEDKEIQSSRPKEEKTELLIPLITKNVWRLPKAEKAEDQNTSDTALSLEQQAVKEILEETRRRNEEVENARSRDPNLVVPLLMQNKVPDGFETDDRLDVALRPDSSNLDDYETVPVEHFGLAALRGMGWKPGDGIGRTNKKFVVPVNVTVRPRGLGLGANMRNLDALKGKAANQEELPFIIGAYVCVVEGNNKGKYGQIQTLDEETGRVLLKMSESDAQLSLPEVFLKVISDQEYKKTLNEAKHKEQTSRSEDCTNGVSSKGSKKRKHKERSRSRSPSSEKSRKREHKKKKKNKDRHRERSESPPQPSLWIHPQLKMRIIDEKYMKGKYFNTKVVIEDVVTPTVCVCRTEDGKLLEDIESRMLETVIPRSEPGHVMVLEGQHKSRVGRILSRDKSLCVATMNLLPDHQNIIKLSYDSICEFVGDVSIYE